MKTITTHSVPEPATATLSLLALTGLAARRRRK
ncbi:MAG: PEP-CTERM sorting domain-containing protein [Akkermansia sp.]|nr:PEP-CTERM sorting domain-containing protein [Akkermansia sp.]